MIVKLIFAKAQDLIALIKNEFIVEIGYYAAPDVAVTAHSVGSSDEENWTQALFEEKVIPSLPPQQKGDRFVEVERTMTAIYTYILQSLPVDEAYEAFVAVQKNNAEIKADEVLKFESFKKIYDKVNSILTNKDKTDVLKRLIIYSDLGKSPQFKRVVKQLAERECIQLDFSKDPDDLITEMLTKLNDQQLGEILPSFKTLSSEAIKLLKTIYPIMKACFGHIYFLERGAFTYEIIAEGLISLPEELRKDAFDLVYLAQLYDGFGAQGQRKIQGSVTCTEYFALGYGLMYESLQVLIAKLGETKKIAESAALSLNDYVNKRAALLGFNTSITAEELFITRMACMIRGFTHEFGAILHEEFHKLSKPHQQLLIKQLCFDNQGLEQWTKTHYIATTPQNVSRELFANGQVREAIAKALSGMTCFAMILDEIATQYPQEISDKSRVISFGEIAFLSTKTPGLFDPNNFDPKSFIFDAKLNKIIEKPKGELQPWQQGLSYKGMVCHFQPASSVMQQVNIEDKSSNEPVERSKASLPTY